MFFLTLFLPLFLHSVAGEAHCAQSGTLTTYIERSQMRGMTYNKTAVNRTKAIQLMYDVVADNLEVESISWKHNGEPISIEGSVNKEIYYLTARHELNMMITLHIQMPNARVTGNWTMSVHTADSAEHVAVCFVQSPPIIRSHLGAVRGKEGKPLSLTCSLETYPPPQTITWAKVTPDESVGNEYTLGPVPNATLISVDGVANARLQWTDATAFSGFYMCTAESSLGVDNQMFEVRIKGMKAVLWPCIGIILELFVLGISIFFYERAQTKRRKEEASKNLLDRSKAQ
ncbi:unnamed protein product [Calicophoron daubneyi]|uniref:Ig-like domain-containing protein n=1 Tax=Calicophoron daubneyi TaxID=300641 RepID=A0AAV2TBJ4_CALDB